jgi:hypothetical protein
MQLMQQRRSCEFMTDDSTYSLAYTFITRCYICKNKDNNNINTVEKENALHLYSAHSNLNTEK